MLASHASAEPEPQMLGFDGPWRLDRTENFEEYLKASGAPWWKRKLAQLGSSSLRQRIQQDGIRFEIESESPVETRTESFVADGVTQRTIEGVTGDTMTWTARIEGNMLVVEGHGDLGHRVIRRERAGAEMLMTIFNPDVNAECKLYFERARAD